MSRRRHTNKQDSLELLLDTICNTFGGVLFIAILVVLLLQQTETGPAVETPSAVPLSPLEMETLTTEFETAADELARRRQNRDSQQAVIQQFAPDEIRRLLSDRADAIIKQESLQSEVDQLLKNNVAIAGHVETLTTENEGILEQLDEAKSRLREAQTKLAESRQSRVEEARLPVIRSVGMRNEIGLVLRYGRLYVWHKYGDDNFSLGLNTDDFVVVSEDGDGLVTRAKPTAGIPLDGSAESQAAVNMVLKRSSPNTCYLAVVVRPDSYEAFRQLRDQCLKLGYEYRLMPAGADSAISDRGGNGGRVQ